MTSVYHSNVFTTNHKTGLVAIILPDFISCFGEASTNLYFRNFNARSGRLLKISCYTVCVETVVTVMISSQFLVYLNLYDTQTCVLTCICPYV